MAKDKRDILKVLEAELNFLERNGYAASPSSPIGSLRIFEDSPTCLNFRDESRPHPCRDCVLMQLVPIGRAEAHPPCRQIPFNDFGETLETLYRWGDMEDCNLVFRHWLITTICRLKHKQASLHLQRTLGGRFYHAPDGV